MAGRGLVVRKTSLMILPRERRRGFYIIRQDLVRHYANDLDGL